MEFCQIQLNYLDWTLQDAKAKYELLTKRKILVWVMEPVRKGCLASFHSLRIVPDTMFVMISRFRTPTGLRIVTRRKIQSPFFRKTLEICCQIC